MMRFVTVACAILSLTSVLGAQDDKSPKEGNERPLAWETGSVAVEGGYATIALPEGWRYLQRRDARYVVEELWGNPPDSDTRGLVAPPGDASWAIIVSYEDSGHIEDGDATGLDYGDLLKEMQTDARAGNAARKKAGYGSVDLLGWAETPHYDSAAKKLYWAKKLQFEGSEHPTLNYDVRVLAAGGVLVMSAVADIGDIAAVSSGVQKVLGATELRAGHRYGDFDSSVHKVAAYGIGGLIAGKVLAKAGLFKLLLKPLLIVLALVGGVLMKVLGGRKKAVTARRAAAEG